VSIAAADLHAALQSAWSASGLDAQFTALWTDDYSLADFPVLHDQEAAPGQPFPYCIIEIDKSKTTTRMSRPEGGKWEIRDVPVTFTIFADNVEDDARSPKQIASDLAEEVMKVFGGHPTMAPTQTIELTNGGHLITQYDNDYPTRDEQDRWAWSITYNFRVDVPSAG
jgi:hypothetical protein